MQNSLKLIFILLMNFQILFSQNTDYIYGTVVDANTKEPIVFANIYLKGRELGVISNKDGGFRFPVQYREMGTVLVISSMGYETKELSILDFSLEANKVIALKPTLLELTEAVVTAPSTKKTLSAKDIVRNAIDNIEVNYPENNFAYVGYYRDYQLKNESYVNLNEAIIKVLDKGFNTLDTVQTDFLIDYYRSNINFEIDSFAAKKYDYNNWDKVVPGARIDSYGGNELILLRVHDAIRNHKLNTFSFINDLYKDFINNHDFILEGTTYFEGSQVYEISISGDIDNGVVKGKIFIGQQNFAIFKLDYGVSLQVPFDNDFQNSHYYHNTRKIKESELIFRVLLEYKRKGEKMFLNFISFKNRFKVVRPPKFKINEVIILPEYKTIQVQFNGPPQKNNRLNRISKYRIMYDEEKVPLSSMLYINDSTLQLRTDATLQRKRVLLRKLFSTVVDPKKLSLNLEFNISDEDGNKLGDRDSQYLYQFRELMVQEIIPYPTESLLNY